ncbi:MAG TPA: hypothetical protein VGP55_14750 [Chitinophagaceae bacterium]|nr:hypothetical protein [Chitinophagaceae bacterium]
MADESTNKTISSTDSGFPGYLDFDKLRSESIAYLGNLSGKIWTDHNVHDPGITILEVLIYAVLDLGYRTNLPAVDLFTRAPEDRSKDNNFFTPAQILANNPLTITDYRKLLIDINGVKNAWLEIEDKLPADFCIRENTIPGTVGNLQEDPCECDYLNGLYHVYIELEKDFDLNDNTQAQTYNDIIDKVKCALMSHRNLCEDFIDIKILCRLKIGLCADIELEPDADGANVYLNMLEALREFFSPSPKFYTLPQLLDKDKTIDEIFAGRPYNIKESFGFVDTDEFEKITLRKKIHLSDVYHTLFDIAGVKNVRNLAWQLCSGTDPLPDITKWELHLPENFIPEFDVKCSGFQFFKYGMKLKLDLSNSDSIFAMNFSANGKILYHQPSPYLDTEIPQGVYRTDLADYYSIQNEFPHVYGIKKGDLASNASDKRKAQALQLQGFLLFFDQLLANYLTQLKNVRSLFALSSSENEDDSHTYFTNELTNVPQLEKLLRFNTGTDGTGTLGSEGSILAYPTNRKNLEELIASGKIKNTDLDRRCNDVNKDDFPEYKFCYAAVRDQVENQLRDDLLNGDFDPVIISNYNDCYFFYCFTSSTDFALISKRYYTNEKEAQTAAASIKYLGTFAENYRSFLIDDCISDNEYFSFDIELNINAYAKYLQLIGEDATLYNTRRQGFLNHLLSRFAEQFTDYALITSGFLTTEQLQKAQIDAEEKFLAKYDDLSSNRGKAYDYLCNGWNNENISGFEKRFKALSGIENWRKHYLCNFVVEKADEIYHLSISLFGRQFIVENKLATYEAGSSSLNSVYKKLGNQPHFEVEYKDHEQKWSVFLRDDFENKYGDPKLFEKKEDAESYSNTLQSVLSFKPSINENIFVSKYIYKILFKTYNDEVIEESKEKFTTVEDAQKYFRKISSKVTNWLNDSKEFSKIKKGLKLEKLIPVNTQNDSVVYIDKDKFEFKPIDVIQLDSVKKKFALLNDQKTIQFDSLINYDTVKFAETGFKDLLILLTSSNNYFAESDKQGNQFKIIIKNVDNNAAVYFQSFNTKEEAENKIEEILNEITAQTYRLSISDPFPDNWEFKYQLTDPGGEGIGFATKANYRSEQNAKEAAVQFYGNIAALKIKQVQNEMQLVSDDKNKIVAHAVLPQEQLAGKTAAAKQLLQYHKDLSFAINDPSKEIINASLAAGKDSNGDQYIYKLVDKDNLLARFPTPLDTKSKALDYKNDLVNKVTSGYNYIGIAFGWDIIDDRKDAVTNAIWYHYLIKCNNIFYKTGTGQGKQLVLFASIKGYTTKEDAMQAFLDDYLIVLRTAHLDTNYGVNKAISLAEILIHENDNCSENQSTVFVPVETIYEYGGDPIVIIKEIILLAKSYPILYISKGRYRFILFNKENEVYDWRSMQWYVTPQEAMQNFLFFLSLLNYSGNFYIEKDETDCRYQIYIREVLAISSHAFSTPSDAWGINGVEKFICIAQSNNGFHNYLNRNNCSYSFYVACGNTGLIHPCKYETPQRRDKILNKLYQAASFNFFDLLQIDTDNSLFLLNLDKRPIAKLLIQRDAANNIDSCEKLIEIFESIYIDRNYDHSKSNDVYLSNEKNIRIAEPVTNDISSADWKRQLIEIACYFPLLTEDVDNAINTTKFQRRCSYYIQIKLPAFDTCNDDMATTNGGCENTDDECKPGCYIAWKSDCCFQSCCDALQFYAGSLKSIANFSNYNPVYECDCGYYGIELHAEDLTAGNVIDPTAIAGALSIERWLCGNNQNPGGGIDNNQNYFTNKCLSEIVALNPQQYNSDTIACEAMARAKKLINSEGLHLVEHILLRPRCENSDHVFEDCNCPYIPQSCIDGVNAANEVNICHFEWKSGGDIDPCSKDETLCFTPGCDPWSFIATIALPAWPERFRSTENRTVIEKLLQKEAPAHVLLRILWLTPRDFCCFEYYFKNWNYWLAKKMCDPEYSNCDFLGLLFYKNFDSLNDCTKCAPCACNDAEPVHCFEDEKIDCANFNLVTQINNLYCWNQNKYDSYNCETYDDVQIPIPIVNNVAKINTVEKPAKAVETSQLKPVVVKTPDSDTHEKYLTIQGRSSKYNENVKKIIAARPGNKVAENALRFLADANPDPERYDDLINKILKNKTDNAKNIMGLTLKQKQVLINNISRQYFDRICLNEKNADKITMHQALFNHLRKNKIDMHLLYDEWNSKEIKTLEPGINFNAIKKVVV